MGGVDKFTTLGIWFGQMTKMIRDRSIATSAPPERTSVLATRRGQLTLAALCGAAFTDFLDGSSVKVALPSIRLTYVQGAFRAKDQGET